MKTLFRALFNLAKLILIFVGLVFMTKHTIDWLDSRDERD